MGNERNSGERSISRLGDASQSPTQATDANVVNYSPYSDKSNLRLLLAQENNLTPQGLPKRGTQPDVQESSPESQVARQLNQFVIMPPGVHCKVAFRPDGSFFVLDGPSSKFNKEVANIIGKIPDNSFWSAVRNMGTKTIDIGNAPPVPTESGLSNSNSSQLKPVRDAGPDNSSSNTDVSTARGSKDLAIKEGLASAIPPGTTVHFWVDGKYLRFQPNTNLSQMQMNAITQALRQHPDVARDIMARGMLDVSSNGVVDKTTQATHPPDNSPKRSPTDARFALSARESHLNTGASDNSLTGNANDRAEPLYLAGDVILPIAGGTRVTLDPRHNVPISGDQQPPYHIVGALQRGTSGAVQSIEGNLRVSKGPSGEETRWFDVTTIHMANGQTYQAGKNQMYASIELHKQTMGGTWSY